MESIDPARGRELRPVRRSQDEQWERNMAAARQFRACEGHLYIAAGQHACINHGDEL